jgi:ectoine hydroxylase-related dioxygenase (phytanoyl-CoA dioxygenase family)
VCAALRPADLCARYERDGYVVVRELIAPPEAAALAGEVRGILAGTPRADVARSQVQHQYGARRTLRTTKVSQLTRTTTTFAELAHRGDVVDVVEALIGPGARLFRDVVVGKPARTGGRFSYHQDSAYWDVEPKALVSVWVALTDAPLEAGCLNVIPGSHTVLRRHGLVLRDRLPVPTRISDGLRRIVSRAGTGDNPGVAGGDPRLWKAKSLVLSSATRWLPILADLQDFRVLPRALDGGEAVPVPLAAGDALLFHSLLVHGSGPNTSDHDRYAAIVSYAPAGARFTGHGVADLPPARRSGSGAR